MSYTQLLSCSYSHICSGCSYLHLSQKEVSELRRQTLLELGISSPIEVEWIDKGGLRDRLEFTLDTDEVGRQRLGLYSKTGNGPKREIIDLEGCPQLSNDLELWLQDFRRDLPPIKRRAGVRLRVSPSGLRGVWLDAANEDLRDLLDESTWFERQLQNNIVIEAGQKRKRVALRSDSSSNNRRVGLIDPVPEAWYETPNLASDGHPNGPALKVFGSVGTFTQPGFRAGRKLVEVVQSHLKALADPNTHRITEFGCGSGTFTLALLANGFQVRAYEFDPLALAALAQGVQSAGFSGDRFHNRLQVFRGDFIQSAKAFAGHQLEATSLKEVLLVDPPRTGLGAFAGQILLLENYQRAPWIYISCFPESFAQDLEQLRKHGYRLTRLSVVEQFPFTKHFELVATIEST